MSGSSLAAAPFRPGRTHKMVFVANMSLKMGAGKMAAQVGHACLGVYRTAVKTEEVGLIIMDIMKVMVITCYFRVNKHWKLGDVMERSRSLSKANLRSS